MVCVVHKQFVLVRLFCVLVTLNCIVSQKKDDTVNQQLLGWILSSATIPSCFDYYSQDNLCLKSPVPIN
ncbi:hypothetical protein IQA73_17210, partial [Leptospira borgpetersenii serovar Ballum]|nr:hypothetical protein [Leptospira borgpetersenii serovar Ballum]